MLMSVEQRFGQYQTPHPVQCLTDNGSGYTAKETIEFGQQLGLILCFTPVRIYASQESSIEWHGRSIC